MIPILVLTLISLMGSCYSSSLIADAQVLIALKHGFAFHDLALSNWNESDISSVCSWVGIRCEHDRVATLDISNFFVGGSVLPVLTGLDHLVELSLAGNNFSGEIVISNLTTLKFLNISNNLFTGGLEWDYADLKQLEVFDTYNNNLTASLPLGIIVLKNLKYLDLGGNYFYGSIPADYGNLFCLEFLSLGGNDLQGKIPGELGNLTNLKQLFLGHYNVFEGGIPGEIGNLVNLVHIDLSNCELDGTIPNQIGNLKLLDTLFLHENLLSGSIPSEIGNLTHLVSLDLSLNVLTGEIPHSFTNLIELRLLNLFLNRLHGLIPDFIEDLPNLETLALWKNNFTGKIPEKLGQNGNIQMLDLSSNKLTGLIPNRLCFKNHLRVLILRENFLFGQIPQSLGKCSSLTRVRMGGNYLNGSIPSGFLYLPELDLMELQDNFLSGVLEGNFIGGTNKNRGKVGELNLSNNFLSGILPSSISNYTALRNLLLSNNKFSGEIPAEIGELQEVVRLDLSKNNFSGEIPPEIGNCSFLTYLDLSQNQLSGRIPAEIAGIHILSYLNLSRNHLAQNIPKSISTMRSLIVADFSFNELTGKLPESGQFLYFNASSFAGNPQLCGYVLHNRCNFTVIPAGRPRIPGNFKLVFPLALLICSLVFAIAAIIKAKSFRKPNSDSWKLTAFQKLEFTVSDILECLKECNVIGRGGAGIVYLGRTENGEEIAVKRLLGFGNNNDHGFRAEIQTLGKIRHRNIVRLLAFCSNSETNLLVYEFMRNGSLGEALHEKKSGFLSNWDLRYKIAVEAAKGLCYLHQDCSPLIIHRDVKSNNILLDSSFEAHVADFGLAKFFRDGGTSESMSAVAGSYGYIAPEYAYTLKVDEKSDVYSFGVVLLELITGRYPVGELEFGEGVDIVHWAKRATNCRKEHLTMIIDPRLNSVPPEEAIHMFFITMLCTQEHSVERPAMREVVQMLSEFPRQRPQYQSSSSSASHRQTIIKERVTCQLKGRLDLLI